MKPYLSLIDTETSGNRCDVTPLFADAESFSRMVSDLAEPFRNSGIDFVAGIDALGFILGATVALSIGAGFIPVRKGGKLPVKTRSTRFTDYSGEVKSLEIRQDIPLREMRVLLIDEWIETGTQVRAAISLIENQGGTVAGIATINIDQNEKTSELRKNYLVHALWREEEKTAGYKL
ncbi:MAG: adenine phosphoribosyltransferase [Candidatus Sabulitectum sp.]|nr:adenine phosphoribosyltransferase [Candidatus Sabulitectum sp.]